MEKEFLDMFLSDKEIQEMPVSYLLLVIRVIKHCFSQLGERS